MTTHTPAPAHQAVLTAEQEIDAIMEQAQVFASAWAFLGGPFDNGSGLETAEREKANLRALLSKLRAPVADERDRNATISEVVGLCNRIPGATTWNAAELMYDEMHRRAALASAPVAGEAVAGYMVGTDYFRPDVLAAARIYAENRNLPVRTLRYADAAPQASEADPLQGAADWLMRAFEPPLSASDLARQLVIGYNRAKRLYDAALSAQPGAQEEKSDA